MNALNSILKRFKFKPSGPLPIVADWEKFEMEVGRSVPTDFKQLIEQTGSTSIGYCWLRNPAERENIGLALTKAALIREHILWNDIVFKMMGVRLFPEPDGLIQLAHIDSISFMLSYQSDNIVICDRGSWEIFESNLIFTDLILSLFTDRTQYDDLGFSIWHSSKELFGWPE